MLIDTNCSFSCYADENDNQGSLKRKVFDFQCVKSGAKRMCLTATERASSEPAVSGVHVLGRLNPQQQDAVKQTPIRSVVVMPVLTSLLHAPKRMKAKTSLACSNKLMPILIRKPSSEVSPQTNVSNAIKATNSFTKYICTVSNNCITICCGLRHWTWATSN